MADTRPMGWPAADQRLETVANESWRHFDETSPREITVTQTVPPKIESLAVPPMPDAVSAVVAHAAKVTDSLKHAVHSSGLGHVGHLTAVLVRADAIASSKIEDITTSSETLAVALADVDDSGDVRNRSEAWLVADNVDTVRAAISAAAEDLSEAWILDLHRNLLANDREIDPRHRGAWRDCPVWVGQTRASADFEGPAHEMVPELIHDFVQFTRRRDLHPIVLAAIAHAQFETIHPFVDGNGRVGRALVHALLGSDRVPVPVAHGLLTDADRYVAGLTAYRAGDLEEWITVFARAVGTGAAAATGLVGSLERLSNSFHERIRTQRGSATDHLLDDLIGNPVVTSTAVKRRYGVTTARASQILNQLKDAGILRHARVATPGRGYVWVAEEVLGTIDAIDEHLPRQQIN